MGDGRAPERLPGGAGQKARQHAERNNLFASSTLDSPRPTYFGTTHASRVDYIMRPQHLTKTLIAQGPLLRLGARL
eukprot:4105595-Pyramimonas_sp.AAC.1